MLLQDLVSRQAEARPDKVALVLDQERMTYGALDLTSNRIAHQLKALGVRRGDRVGLALPKTPLTVACMLGVLKADAAYVPLDPAAPAPRVERVLRAAEPRALVHHPEAAALLGGLRGAGAVADMLVGPCDGRAGQGDAFSLGEREGFPADRPPQANGPQDIVHLLFTSGSTGLPKGVKITHANVIAFLDWAIAYFGMTAEDRTSGHSPLQFDLSTFDVYGSLVAGAELHLVPPQLNLQPHKLVRLMRDAGLTQWFSVPSILNLIIRSNALAQGDLPALRRMLWCGEVLPTPTLVACMERLPHVAFTNLYGPTEATIASSYYTVPAIPAPADAVPIGRACAGEELLILDDDMQPVPPGVVGNLHIGGAGLSPGYWRDEEKTRAAFLPDFRRPGSGALYRTGDLARLREDGEVIFLGRSDTQIKSRGYRIELGEIEAVLSTFQELDECAVVGIPTDGFEGTAICCAFAAAPDQRIELAELRRRLSALLPFYMVPARWQAFAALPKNSNGKIDRPRLRDAFATPPETPH